jgi:hypothetical protein
LIVLAGFAVVSIAAESRLSGQQRTASSRISASVVEELHHYNRAGGLRHYDSVTANATAPLDGIGTVTVTCTKGRRPRWV